MSSIFQTKTVDELIGGSGPAGSGMKRTLTTFDLVMLGIGAVIGAGIFSSIGTAAVGEVAQDGTVIRYGAGPALTLSFVLLGAVCALAGLCYAELTAMIPVSGSAYTYAYATLGELVAWIIGWDLILEYAVGNVAVAIAWSGYFASFLRFFGIEIPFWLCHSYRDVAFSYPEHMDKLPILFGHHVAINVPAIVIVGLITWLLVIGGKESARVNNVMVVIKLSVLALFICVCFFYIAPTVGETLGIVAFVTVSLGGFGSVPGALVAGLLIGVIESVSAYWIGAVYKDIVVYSLFLCFLWFRPQGLMGKM